MRPSRGMGAIREGKLPKKGKRKDGDTFDMYAEGGPIWEQPNPKKASKKLSPAKKTAAMARAKKAGRPYPNAVDNIAAARKK
jgi:hypothetical protein